MITPQLEGWRAKAAQREERLDRFREEYAGLKQWQKEGEHVNE